MESEREQNFNDRLNQWIASQGFWFQLKYSMSGTKGVSGSGGYHMLRLVFRVLVFLLIVGAVASIYLFRLPNTEGFAKRLEGSIGNSLRAKELMLSGLSREEGRMSVDRLAAIGKDDAFFTDFEAKNIGCRMGLLDSVRGPWKTGGITISELSLNLRAGAKDGGSVAAMEEALFAAFPGVEINAIDTDHAVVSWGFTALASGRIEGSQMKVRRRADGWWIQFQGGTFSQNWLKGLEIEVLNIICTRNGVTIEKGLLKKGAGRVVISGMTIKGAEKPVVEGTAKITNMPLDGMLPQSAGYMVDGAISGTLKFSGSTNSSEGIGMSGRFVLGEEDGLILHERIPLLRALRMVDSFNNYRRVRFQSGSFELKSGGGRLELSEVDLKAGDLMTLRGAMTARPPTKEEKDKLVELPSTDSPLALEPGVKKSGDEDEFTLKRAAQLGRKKITGNLNSEVRRFLEHYEAAVGERVLEAQTASKLTESLRYEGAFQLTIRQDAFDQAPQLKAAYPVDKGRISLLVPISGTLDLVTFPQAEELYGKGKR